MEPSAVPATPLPSRLDPTSRIPEPQNVDQHHRRNHRSGAKERTRRERKELQSLAGSTPGTPTGSSWSGSVMGGRKKGSGHRAGLKYKARKEKNAFGLTVDFVDLESDAGYEVGMEMLEEGAGEEEAIEEYMDGEVEERDSVIGDLEDMEYIAPTYTQEGNKKGGFEDAAEEVSDIVVDLKFGQKKNANTDSEELDMEDDDDDRAPSLTYDSDDNHDEIEEQDLATVTATPQKLHQQLDIPVRERADTGSFQEKVEAEIGIMTPTKALKEAPTTTTEMTSAAQDLQKPRIKHEIKLLGLRRPEVLRGGNATLNPHVKHEVKLLGLKRPEVLKGGSGGMSVVREHQHEVKLVSLMQPKKLKQGGSI